MRDNEYTGFWEAIYRALVLLCLMAMAANDIMGWWNYLVFQLTGELP